MTELLEPGFVVFLGFEGHDISSVEMFYEHYTTNFFWNIVALFMDVILDISDRNFSFLQSIEELRYAVNPYLKSQVREIRTWGSVGVRATSRAMSLR